MRVREKVEKEFASWIKYCEEDISRVRSHKEEALRFSDLLDEFGVGEEKILCSYDYIEVNEESIEAARKLLGDILRESDISTFTKISIAFSSGVKWFFVVERGGVRLRVGPAEPSKDCVAVQKTNTYTTWICEKRGGEGE